MDQLERPDEPTWDERRLWFEAREAAASAAGAGRLSEQACALMIDLQAVFCAGAWAAAVIVAASVVEAQAFLAGFPNDGREGDRAWLRGLRNRLVHESPKQPALTIEDQWLARGEWERTARKAVEIALAALYGVPVDAPHRPARSGRAP